MLPPRIVFVSKLACDPVSVESQISDTTPPPPLPPEMIGTRLGLSS
jgi:hypothetical protein